MAAPGTETERHDRVLPRRVHSEDGLGQRAHAGREAFVREEILTPGFGQAGLKNFGKLPTYLPAWNGPGNRPDLQARTRRRRTRRQCAGICRLRPARHLHAAADRQGRARHRERRCRAADAAQPDPHGEPARTSRLHHWQLTEARPDAGAKKAAVATSPSPTRSSPRRFSSWSPSWLSDPRYALAVADQIQLSSMIREPIFVGLGNYAALLGSSGFREALANTLRLHRAVPSAVSSAAACWRPPRSTPCRDSATLFRTAIFLPIIVGESVAGVIFTWIFSRDFGLFNQFLGAIGLGAWERGWVADPRFALTAIVVVELVAPARCRHADLPGRTALDPGGALRRGRGGRRRAGGRRSSASRVPNLRDPFRHRRGVGAGAGVQDLRRALRDDAWRTGRSNRDPLSPCLERGLQVLRDGPGLGGRLCRRLLDPFLFGPGLWLRPVRRGRPATCGLTARRLTALLAYAGAGRPGRSVRRAAGLGAELLVQVGQGDLHGARAFLPGAARPCRTISGSSSPCRSSPATC